MNKHQRSIQKCAESYAYYQLIPYDQAKTIILNHHRSGGWPEVEKVMHESMMSMFNQSAAARHEQALRNELERLKAGEAASLYLLDLYEQRTAHTAIDIAILNMARVLCRKTLTTTRARIDQICNELRERSQRKQAQNHKEP